MPFQPGFKGAAPRTVSHSFLAGAQSTTSSTTQTFAGLSFGTASAGRYLLACVYSVGATGHDQTAVTIGGVSATSVLTVSSAFGANTQRIEFWIANVPTGTSGSVVATTSNNAVRAAVQLYSLEGMVSSTPSDTATNSGSGASLSGSLDMPAGGVIIAAAAGVDTSLVGSVTWTGVTEDSDVNFGGAIGIIASSGSLFSFSPQSGLTVQATFSTTPAASVLAAAAWSPN